MRPKGGKLLEPVAICHQTQRLRVSNRPMMTTNPPTRGMGSLWIFLCPSGLSTRPKGTAQRRNKGVITKADAKAQRNGHASSARFSVGVSANKNTGSMPQDTLASIASSSITDAP